MNLRERLRSHATAFGACGAALLACALLWVVRAAPLQPAPALRVDALGAFFAFALFGGMALVALARPGAALGGWRSLGAAALLLGAWATTLTPAIAGAYVLVALLMVADGRPPTGDGRPPREQRARQVFRRRLFAAPPLLAAGALLVGYGALALRGTLRYDARTAGLAFDGFAFWFVLLAATAAILDVRFWNVDGDSAHSKLQPASFQGLSEILRVAWLYPLARLYSLGPWNSGWSFAALLLGGAAALWAAAGALLRPAARRELTLASLYGLALAGFGLSSSAGIAAGCYLVLANLVVAVGTKDEGRRTKDEGRRTKDEGRTSDDEQRITGDVRTRYIASLPTPIPHPPSPTLRWLLSGALPLGAPFVAVWMLIGASVAGGVALLAGAAWLVLLLGALAAALGEAAPAGATRPLRVAAFASLVLGVGVPLVILALIQPVIEQLQGGLTPYGDVDIWPWVGLAAIDAAHTQATALPSIAVAALMLVLSALVYLAARLRDAWDPDKTGSATAGPRLDALFTRLRGEVPWLDALARRSAGEEQRIDGE
jgi:hypothetical protein